MRSLSARGRLEEEPELSGERQESVLRAPKGKSGGFPHPLLKPLLVAVSVYVSVVATVVELWGRSSSEVLGSTSPPPSPPRPAASNAAVSAATAAPWAPSLPSQGQPVAAAVAASSAPSAPAAPHAPALAAVSRSSPSGKPTTLKGDLLEASWAWANPGTDGLIGDQRHRGNVTGFMPTLLRPNGVDLGWKEMFEISFGSGKRIRARECRLVDRSELPESAGVELAQIGGESVTLSCPLDLQVQWSVALMRLVGGAEVLRVRVLFHGTSPEGRQEAANAQQLIVWSLDTPAHCGLGAGSNNATAAPRTLGASCCLEASGVVDGSPLVDAALGVWMALEHPRATMLAHANVLSVAIAQPTPSTAYLSSLGVTLPKAGGTGSERDQFPWLRRHFQEYLDVIRASAYRQQLYYGTWYDLRRRPCEDSSTLGQPFCKAAHPLNEQKVLERVKSMTSELSSRGARLDGVLLDDGWDNAEDPWEVDPTNFPRGLAPLGEAAAALGASVGVWLSPWGGYGEGGKRRLRLGAAKGLETYEGSPHTFRLAGPRYRALLRNVSRRLVLNSDIRMFKFDGFGAGLGASGADRFPEDVDRLLWLADELRETAREAGKADLWVTVSTGSWPSPFWLLSGSAIWRGGPDLGRQGFGSPRQQWITFRDSMVYLWVVKRAPLFPLSSLALGGVVWSSVEEPGAYLSSYDLEDFRSEVRSYFLSGAALQELLIQPALLTAEHWDVVADAANKSRRFSGLLRDSHWAGGDPGVGEVYGYASYGCTPCTGLLSWRNPQGVPQNLTFALRAALSLPQAWPGGSVGGKWHLSPVWPTLPPQGGEAGDGGAAASPSPAAAGACERRFGAVSLDEELRVEFGAFEHWAVLALPLAP